MAGGGTALRRSVPAPASAVRRAENVNAQTTIDLGAGHSRWGARPWDPNHRPDGTALERRYDVATSFYVLNVIPEPAERRAHLRLARRLLKPGGRFYAAVRTDNVCGLGERKRTTKGCGGCRPLDAWRADLIKVGFQGVRKLECRSGYCTLVGER